MGPHNLVINERNSKWNATFLGMGRTGRARIAGIAVIDFGGLLFRNRMISVQFELEYVEFEVFIPGILFLKSLKMNAG